MKLKSLGVIVALVALTSFFYGCTTRPQGIASDDPGLGTFTRENGRTPGGECQWSFDREGGSKKIRNLTLDVTNGTCSVNSAKPFFMGLEADQVREVKKLDGNIDIINLGGSCRYCYVNSNNGLTCVSYPGNC